MTGKRRALKPKEKKAPEEGSRQRDYPDTPPVKASRGQICFWEYLKKMPQVDATWEDLNDFQQRWWEEHARGGHYQEPETNGTVPSAEHAHGMRVVFYVGGDLIRDCQLDAETWAECLTIAKQHDR